MREWVQATIPGNPCPKPRMTRRDGWARLPVRPVVAAYRSWADRARLAAPFLVADEAPLVVIVWAHIGMPSTWSESKRRSKEGRLHLSTPDVDNIVKAVFDTFWKSDSGIGACVAVKIWSRVPRVHVVATWTQSLAYRCILRATTLWKGGDDE